MNKHISKILKNKTFLYTLIVLNVITVSVGLASDDRDVMLIGLLSLSALLLSLEMNKYQK